MSTPKQVPIVTFTSGKGGCGKTTIAVNFAHSVYKAQKGNKVLVIDFDISNRGSTGIFSNWLEKPDDVLTLTRLLRDEHTDYINKITEIEEGFYFVPASSASEEIWKEPVKYNLESLANNLRGKLYELASIINADCVVLDCFCGIDLLTTLGSASADHTIIVNEPDIVTFTGSLTLKSHLDRSFEKLSRKPNIHFVINRVRSDQKVEELNELYKENLMKEVNHAVLTYIPYNNKIFKHFGSYPFFVNLLPRSLFTKKIEQIAYILFVDSNPNLIRNKVSKWSLKKFKRIYLKSIDRSAVDTEYLLTKIISVPLFLGLLLTVTILLLKACKLTPNMAWILVLMILSSSFLIYFLRLLSTAWIIARQYFTLSGFLYRIGIKSRFRESRLKELSKTIIPFFSGLLITISVIWLAISGLGLALISYEYVFTADTETIGWSSETFVDYDLPHNYEDNTLAHSKYAELILKKEPYLEYYEQNIANRDYFKSLKTTTFLYTAMELPLRKLNLKNQTVLNTNFMFWSNLLVKAYYQDSYDFSRNVIFEDAVFGYCQMPENLLNSELHNVEFNYCNFYGQAYQHQDIIDKYVHSDLKYDFEYFAHTASHGDYFNMKINGLMLPGIFFHECSFEEVTIRLDNNNFIALLDCNIQSLEVQLKSKNSEDIAFVFIEEKDRINLKIDPNIKVIDVSEFKNKCYDEVYLNISNLDEKIRLYDYIISYENELSYIEDKRRSFKNMSEYYMMTYDTIFYDRISTLLDSLDLLIKEAEKDTQDYSDLTMADRGIYYVLVTTFSILRNESPEIENAFKKFHEWIYDDSTGFKDEMDEFATGNYKLGLWSFGMWNDHMLLNANKLTHSQVILLNLIQEIAYNEVSSNESWAIIKEHTTNPNNSLETRTNIELITERYYEFEKINKLKEIRNTLY